MQTGNYSTGDKCRELEGPGQHPGQSGSRSGRASEMRRHLI